MSYPGKTISVETLRQQQPASSSSGRIKREAAQARRFEKFRNLVQWLQARQEQGVNDGKIIVPMPSSMLNDDVGRAAHWGEKVSRHNEYLGQIRTLGTLSLLPTPPKEPPQKARLEAVFYTERDNDQSGLMERCKWPVDWLVKAGWLKDDNQKHLEWAGVPTQIRVGKGEPPRVEFQITAL